MNELHLQKSNILRNHQLQHGPVMKQDNITHKLWHLCLFSTNMVPWKEPSNQPITGWDHFHGKKIMNLIATSANHWWIHCGEILLTPVLPTLDLAILWCCSVASYLAMAPIFFLVEIGVTGSWLGTSTGTVSVEITEAFIFCQNTKV